MIRDTTVPAPIAAVSTARPGDAGRSQGRSGREPFHFGGRHGEGPALADRYPRPPYVWPRPPIYRPRPYCPPRPYCRPHHGWGFSFGFCFGQPLYAPPIVAVPGPVFVEPAYMVPSPAFVAAPAVVQEPAVAAYAEAPAAGYGYPGSAAVVEPAPQAPAEAEAQPVIPPPADQQPPPPPAGREQPLLAPPPASAQPSAPSEAPPLAEGQVPGAAPQALAAAVTTQPASEQGQAAAEDQARVEEEFGRRMEEGATAFANGDFDKARHAFVLAILAIPDNVDAKLAYAITQFAIGDYHVAAILLRQVIPAHPEVVWSDFDLRERYERKEKLAQQIGAMRTYINTHPKDVEPMLVLGFVQHFSGLRDEAKRTFTEALKLSPKEPVASVFLNPPPMEVATTEPAVQGAAAVPVTPPTTQPAAAGQLPTTGK